MVKFIIITTLPLKGGAACLKYIVDAKAVIPGTSVETAPTGQQATMKKHTEGQALGNSVTNAELKKPMELAATRSAET